MLAETTPLFYIHVFPDCGLFHCAKVSGVQEEKS